MKSRIREDLSEGGRFAAYMLIGGVAAIIVALVLAAMAVFGFGLFAQKTANFRGETSKRNQVEANGAFRIQAYNSFFDLCTDVQAKEATIAALNDELATNPPESRVVQIHQAITANKAVRATDIAQYNNDARKGYTQGQFLASNLPWRLDPSAEVTECAVQ